MADAAALYCAQQGSLVSRLVTTGWAVLAPSQPRDFQVAREDSDARLFRDAICASVTCAPVRSIRWHAALGRAHTRLPLCSATWAHFCISTNRPRAVANRRRRRATQPTSVTALGGISVGDGRVAAGVSESPPAKADGDSDFPANYSRSGPTIVRDYSRRPRRGRAHAPDYGAAEPGLRSHWPRIT